MKRVLFVDDEPKILEALQRSLRAQRLELEVAFASGGEAALTMLAAAPFDVVVSDMRMPGMDGAALLDTVRRQYPSILRIILSGYTEMEASLRAVPVAHQFLLKPCDPDTLRAAIDRATSLVEALNSKMMASLVGAMQDLPSIPRTYMELRKALADPETSIDRVVRIVEKDVAISAKILQLVNSAFFGLTRDISDIKMAVNYLGINILQNLVVSVEAFRMFQPKKAIPGFSIEELHSHSQLTARIAAHFPAEKKLPGAVVVAALLHDVGKLVLAERAPDHFARAVSGAREERRPLFLVEEELIGVSHAEVGAYLLSLWGLPYPVIEAVAHHHHPERVPQHKLDMITVIYLSNLLAHEVDSDAGRASLVHRDIDPDVLKAIGAEDQLLEWRQMAEAVAHEPQGV
ncbi:MAG: HDOD domain-containing protein [Candidatus Acidiferrales bacterium]